MQEVSPQARALLDKTNRQFNESNALYHTVAQRCGLSDTAFWVLYALYTDAEPLTQNRLAAEWALPKQTLNSAVAAMVKKGMVTLSPGQGAHSGKIIALTEKGRAVANRTVAPVIYAEQEALTAVGLDEMETSWRICQEHLKRLRSQFDTLDLHKQE